MEQRQLPQAGSKGPEDSQDIVTAALLVIGDEILSGRTKDKNTGYIADYMTAIGIRLGEVRVVSDIEDEIVSAINALREKYTYVFTTGGIGPTHDDITADAVARAFGVSIDIDERAVAMMRGTPAMTMTLPIMNPGALETEFSIRSAPSGMRAMRSRVSVRSPGA